MLVPGHVGKEPKAVPDEAMAVAATSPQSVQIQDSQRAARPRQDPLRFKLRKRDGDTGPADSQGVRE